MAPEYLNNLAIGAELATIVAALIPILYTLGRIGRKIVSYITNKIRYISEAVERIDKALPTLFAVAEEFKPNGGSSFRDSINRIERDIYKLKDIHKSTLNFLPIELGYFETNETGQCIWANDTYLRILDTTLEEVAGNGWVSFIHEDDRERIHTEWERCFIDKRNFHAIYTLTTDKGTISVEGYASLLYDRNRNIIGSFGTIKPLDSVKFCAKLVQ